jgi:hypothetical protein
MDYYETLGVSRNASPTEIRNAYRRLAKQYHPDRNSSEHAKTYIQLINEAYETLSDSAKRSQYDQPIAFTFVVEEAPQADPREAQRKENFRRWQEREREKRKEEEAYKLYAFNQFKKYNLFIVIWVFFLVIDEYVLPTHISNEVIIDAATTRSRNRQVVYIAKTESFVLAIPKLVIDNFREEKLRIESSRILNIPLRVSASDGISVDVTRTIFAFILPIPLIILVFSSLLYLIREPGNWATLVLSMECIAILTLIALWLISFGDKNLF